MIERQLTRILKASVRHSASGEAWPWAFIGVAAYLLRRAMREPEDVKRVKVRRGHEVTIAVHDQDH